MRQNPGEDAEISASNQADDGASPADPPRTDHDRPTDRRAPTTARPRLSVDRAQARCRGRFGGGRTCVPSLLSLLRKTTMNRGVKIGLIAGGLACCVVAYGLRIPEAKAQPKARAEAHWEYK